MEKLTEHDYKMAVWSQEACNLSGVVFEFARVMQKICDEAREGQHGTDWKNTHPICRLYAEQIMHLASGIDYAQAYELCNSEAGII